MAARRARSIFARVSFWIGAILVALVVAIAAYEIEANRQHIGIIALEHALQSKNVDNMPFDPSREALVFDGTARTDILVHYELPAVYARGVTGALTAYTLAPPAGCAAGQTAPAATAHLDGPPLDVCIAPTVAEPANVLDVGTADPFTELDGRPFFPSGPTLTFIRNGRRQGTFTAGAVDILPYIPQLAVACDPGCGIKLKPERFVLDALSGPADSRAADPLPTILGLSPRSLKELSALESQRSEQDQD